MCPDRGQGPTLQTRYMPLTGSVGTCSTYCAHRPEFSFLNPHPMTPFENRSKGEEMEERMEKERDGCEGETTIRCFLYVPNWESNSQDMYVP